MPDGITLTCQLCGTQRSAAGEAPTAGQIQPSRIRPCQKCTSDTMHFAARGGASTFMNHARDTDKRRRR